jgi:hypothetical protein
MKHQKFEGIPSVEQGIEDRTEKFIILREALMIED